MTNMSDAVVERNTIVNSRFAIATMGDIPGIVYRNNVFVSGAEMLDVTWGPGGFQRSTFKGNLSSAESGAAATGGKDSPFTTPDTWTATGGIFADPQLRLPASTADLPTDPRKLAAMEWFKPLGGSPCLAGGRQVRGASLGESSRG
jgi:hypothetical protein